MPGGSCTRLPWVHHYTRGVDVRMIDHMFSDTVEEAAEQRIDDLLEREARAVMALWTFARDTRIALYDEVRDHAAAPTGVDPDGWDRVLCIADPDGYEQYVTRLENGLDEAIDAHAAYRDVSWRRLLGAGS